MKILFGNFQLSPQDDNQEMITSLSHQMASSFGNLTRDINKTMAKEVALPIQKLIMSIGNWKTNIDQEVETSIKDLEQNLINNVSSPGEYSEVGKLRSDPSS